MSLPRSLRRFQLKAAIQGGLSLLPAPARWNRWFQTHVTRSVHANPSFIERKWAIVRRHHEHHLRASTVAWRDATVLELGTGWVPIVPVGLFLLGARRVITLDRQDLLAGPIVAELLRGMAKLARAGRLGAVDEQRLATLEAAGGTALPAGERPVTALLDRLAIDRRIADARTSGLPEATVDLFVSNSTLEHIPREILAAILVEFRRIATPGAAMSHLIDLADHYAGFDPHISIYNFLRYSEPAWRWYNNPLQYQNRLRVNDYRALHAAAGWSITSEDDTLGAPEDLRRIVLAEPFASYDERDLLPHESWMVSTPAP